MGKWGLLCKIEDQMRTISAVWSSWGPSPQLRTFTKALNRGTNFWVMIYPAISSPSYQGCIKSSLPVLFRSDSFTMFTSYEQFQNFLLVIYSFGTYGTSLIYSFKIFWLSTPDSFAIPPPRCPPSWSNSIMHPGWQSITKIIHFVSNVDQFGTQLQTFLKGLDFGWRLYVNTEQPIIAL